VPLVLVGIVIHPHGGAWPHGREAPERRLARARLGQRAELGNFPVSAVIALAATAGGVISTSRFGGTPLGIGLQLHL